MSNQLVSEAEVERALDFLRDSAQQIADAKADIIRAEHQLKHIKAITMKHCGETSAAAQEREAVASESYQENYFAIAKAYAEYERLKALREAAAAKIEAWRTASSNYRSMKL